MVDYTLTLVDLDRLRPGQARRDLADLRYVAQRCDDAGVQSPLSTQIEYLEDVCAAFDSLDPGSTVNEIDLYYDLVYPCSRYSYREVTLDAHWCKHDRGVMGETAEFLDAHSPEGGKLWRKLRGGVGRTDHEPVTFRWAGHDFPVVDTGSRIDGFVQGSELRRLRESILSARDDLDAFLTESVQSYDAVHGTRHPILQVYGWCTEYRTSDSAAIFWEAM